MSKLKILGAVVGCFIFAMLLVVPAEPAEAQVLVRGYFRRDGTYVRPHLRTYPDGNPYNNYSFPGNFNPNTGTITPGDPLAYLRRYYATRPPTLYSSPIPRAARTASPLADEDVARLPSLPGWVAPEEFWRSRAYCRWLWGGDALSVSRCQLRQYRALAALVLPDYSGLPSGELARSQRYCEWLFQDDRASFYDCLNRQVLVLREGAVTFLGVTPDEERRARRYCEWLFGDNRGGNRACLEGQARALSQGEPSTAGLPLAEWNRAVAYCEWVFGDNRAGAKQCRAGQAQGIAWAQQAGLTSRPMPQSVASYCEWLFANNRAAYWRCVASRL